MFSAFFGSDRKLLSCAALAAMASPEAEEMKRSIERILLLIPDWKMYNMVKQEEGVEAMTRVVLFGH